MTDRPRRQYSFATAQSSEMTDYKPGRTRNADRERMFAGHKGIVIPWQQKVGAVAMARSFDLILEENSDEDIQQIAGIFATVSFGTSFHAFAQRAQRRDRVMRRHGQLPDMLDRETGEPIGYDGLDSRIRTGLSVAASLATDIESMVRNKARPKSVKQKNYQMGRVTLNNALSLAALEFDVPRLESGEMALQDAAWDAAEAVAQRSIDLTDMLGVRPTIALLVDPSSDYSIYLHDNIDVISRDNYDILSANLREAADEFTIAA